MVAVHCFVVKISEMEAAATKLREGAEGLGISKEGFGNVIEKFDLK